MTASTLGGNLTELLKWAKLWLELRVMLTSSIPAMVDTTDLKRNGRLSRTLLG